MARRCWIYRLEVERKRHRRGYGYDQYKVVRDDNKVVALPYNKAHAERTIAKFRAWATQGWYRQ